MSDNIIPGMAPLEWSVDAQIDDDSMLVKLQRGELSRAESLTLRKLLGALTFAEWVDETDRSEPYRVADARLLEVMQIRTAMLARRDRLARCAPWLLMPAVVQP